MINKKINCQLYVVKAAEGYTKNEIMQGDILIVDGSLLIGGVVEIIRSLTKTTIGGNCVC